LIHVVLCYAMVELLQVMSGCVLESLDQKTLGFVVQIALPR
jgi:hypothetical protein